MKNALYVVHVTPPFTHNMFPFFLKEKVGNVFFCKSGSILLLSVKKTQNRQKKLTQLGCKVSRDSYVFLWKVYLSNPIGIKNVFSVMGAIGFQFGTLLRYLTTHLGSSSILAFFTHSRFKFSLIKLNLIKCYTIQCRASLPFHIGYKLIGKCSGFTHKNTRYLRY